jgi:hypothetical protein
MSDLSWFQATADRKMTLTTGDVVTMMIILN